MCNDKLTSGLLLCVGSWHRSKKIDQHQNDGSRHSLLNVCPLLRYGDFSIFQDGGRPQLGFLKCRNFNGRDGQEGQTNCVTVQNFVAIGRTVANCGGFALCVFAPEGHLVVFIDVQNLVGIDAVVLIICMFFDFTSLA